MEMCSTQGGEMSQTKVRNASGVLVWFHTAGVLCCVIQLVAGGIMGR